MRLITLAFLGHLVLGCSAGGEQSSDDAASLRGKVEDIVDVKFAGTLPNGWSHLKVNDAEKRSGAEKIIFSRNGNFLAGPDSMFLRIDRLPPGSPAFTTIKRRAKGSRLPGAIGDWEVFEDTKPKGRITFLGMYSREKTQSDSLVVTAMQINGTAPVDSKPIRVILSQL